MPPVPEMPPTRERFWETTPLEEMTPAQWERLCDGCARCCVHKLQDEDSGEVYYTDVACRLLDSHRCRCTDYANRRRQVPSCLSLTPRVLSDCFWLPNTCAYRLLAANKPLPVWHPLITGNADSVHRVGVSVRGRVMHIDRPDDDLLRSRIVEIYHPDSGIRMRIRRPRIMPG